MAIVTAADILNDIALATELMAKITGNMVIAKAVLSETDLAAARERLASIQAQGLVLDAEFDAALAAARANQ